MKVRTKEILEKIIEAEYNYFSNQIEEFNFIILPWKLEYGIKAQLNKDLVFNLIKKLKIHFLSDDLLHLNLSFPFHNGNKVIIFQLAFERQSILSTFHLIKINTYVIVKGGILRKNQKKKLTLRTNSKMFSKNKITKIAFETINSYLKMEKIQQQIDFVEGTRI